MDSETPMSLQQPHVQLSSIPGQSDLSTIHHNEVVSNNNSMINSHLLNKQSELRQSDGTQTPQVALQQSREESEKSLGTMILREAKEEEPSVHNDLENAQQVQNSNEYG